MSDQTILSLINQFVYRPDATYAREGFTPAALGLDFEEVRPVASDGTSLSGWYLPAERPHHALMYCHGNAGDIRDWVHAAPPFINSGISILIWDYRGYGQSEGQPSEAGLYMDGEAMWHWLEDRARRDRASASILGKSLGSAVACHIATRFQPVSLVLDSAFTSMREVVAQNAPWVPPKLFPPLFESLDLAPQIECPTLVIHGGRDTLVPPEQGRRLFEAINGPKWMRLIEYAGHNDISMYPEYMSWIVEFLQQQE